jgi:hypothetical protein
VPPLRLCGEKWPKLGHLCLGTLPKFLKYTTPPQESSASPSSLKPKHTPSSPRSALFGLLALLFLFLFLQKVSESYPRDAFLLRRSEPGSGTILFPALLPSIGYHQYPAICRSWRIAQRTMPEFDRCLRMRCPGLPPGYCCVPLSLRGPRRTVALFPIRTTPPAYFFLFFTEHH